MGSRSRCFLALGIAVHLLFLASLYTGWLNLFFNDSSHTGQAFDFAVYYIAGKALAAGHDVYSVEAAFGYRYLPAFAYTISRFFALLPPQTAYFLYLFLCEALLVANLRLVWRWGANNDIRTQAACMWLAFSPFYLELYIGQVSFLAASLLFWAFYAEAHRVPRAAGIAWIGAVLLKPNALILVPAYLRQRRFKQLAWGALLVIATSVPYFWTYPDAWAIFVERNLSGNQITGGLTHAGNIGLWGGLVSLGAKLSAIPLETLSSLSQLPLWVRLMANGVPALVVAGALWATFRGKALGLESLCLWVTTYFLVYKDVWEHHLVFLLPVLGALFLHTRQRALLWIWALLALPTPYIFFDISPGVHGNIDPERTWSLMTSLAYRAASLGPVAALWLWLVQRLRGSDSKARQQAA
jgi:hypothetical protein